MNANNSVVGFMKHKNTEKLGYMKYAYFKKIIKYILDYHREYHIRKLFLNMYEEGYFLRKTVNGKTSYTYKFNPNPKIKNYNVIKSPQEFIVSWE